MPFFVGFGVWVLVLLVFGILIGSFFMWIAAKIARVEKSGFGRALVASIGSTFMAVILSFVFGVVPLVGNGLGFLIGLFFSILIIKAAFDTTVGKALLVWIFNIIAVVIATALTALVTAGSLFFLSCG
jgi:hypothetical protein